MAERAAAQDEPRVDLHRVGAGRAAAERVGRGDGEAVDAGLPRRAVELRGRRAVAPELEPRRQRARDEPVARGPVALRAREEARSRSSRAGTSPRRPRPTRPSSTTARPGARGRERGREDDGHDRDSCAPPPLATCQVYQRLRGRFQLQCRDALDGRSSRSPPSSPCSARARAAAAATAVTKEQLAVMVVPKSQLGSLGSGLEVAARLGRRRQRHGRRQLRSTRRTRARNSRGPGG